ncbi:ParB/Srx family N-terminal domain-containing protein [Bdellovibrionota bacterium FG-1]
MPRHLAYLVFLLLFGLGALPSLAKTLPRCHANMAEGTECLGLINELHPTQPEVGKREVDSKREKFKALRKEGTEKFEKFKRAKIVPAVIGPYGGFYLVDHHHTAIALSEIGEAEVYVKIIKNWSKLKVDQPLATRMGRFWEKMKEQHLAWFERENGNILDPLSAEWPTSLAECGNNQLRAVVSELIENGVIEKVQKPFFEFYLSKYLREKGLKVEAVGHKQAYRIAKDLVNTPEGRRITHKFKCLMGILESLGT